MVTAGTSEMPFLRLSATQKSGSLPTWTPPGSGTSPGPSRSAITAMHGAPAPRSRAARGPASGPACAPRVGRWQRRGARGAADPRGDQPRLLWQGNVIVVDERQRGGRGEYEAVGG